MRLMRETGAHPRYPGSMRYADDYVFMALQAATQWDALAHVFYDEQLYNGFPASTITEDGAQHCGLNGAFGGVTGRAVLLDVARHRGVSWLAPGAAIGPQELEEIADAQSVELRGGDVLLLRTGWIEKFFTDRSQSEFKAGEPGLSFACAEWLRARDVMAVAADNYAVEVIPHELEGETMPLHMVLLRDVGMMLGEMFDLSALAADCAEDGVYEAFFCAPPIKFPQAVGSPINPLAIK
jgi:kynurenine formamidase